MGKRKPTRVKTPRSKSRLEQEESVVETFSEIGGSPVPGFTLRHVLSGHANRIGRIAWSPDGAYLASPSTDNTIRIWNARTGACVHTLKGHTLAVNSVACSPDGHRLASASDDKTIRLWETAGGQLLQTIEAHTTGVKDVAWSPDGHRLISGSNDLTIRIWDTNTWKVVMETSTREELIHVAWSPNSRTVAIGTSGTAVLLWDTETGEVSYLDSTSYALGMAWSRDGKTLAASSMELLIHDVESGRTIARLEGHTKPITSLDFSADNRILASKSDDGTIRFWRTDSWACVGALVETEGRTGPFPLFDLAFHPHLSLLASATEKHSIIKIWDIDEDSLFSLFVSDSVHYTTAKLVLVGDSGVGKTGLGWRLAHDEFKEHASTHGQQFWPIPQLGLKRADGTECEAVLWDLAGQHVYRQIHSIFLENVAAALVLFDASNRQEPLKGVQFWLEQLKGKGQLPPAVLVGARVDVSPPALSQQEFDQFCQRYGIRGGYISTSALKGEGLDVLLERLKAQIPWEEMTATVTTVTFKRIKDFVLALKEKPDREGVLVNPQALRKQLQETDQDWRFTDAEMMTAVGHLETHGYVAVLHDSAGEQYILLTPELLGTLAASIVMLADKHPRELGAVSETELLQGKYPFDELVGLSPTESQILLDAAILRFLQHNICFRETLDNDTLLIFPSLIKQKRPLQDDIPSTDDISYVVRGRVENLYASLVVLLGYTPSFTRINQWQNQAQYEMGEGEICGFRLIEEREGELEVVLYYGDRLPTHGRAQFQGLFEQFLYQRDVEVTRFPPVLCPENHRQERATIIKRVREGKRFVFCEECGKKTDLPNFDKPQTVGIGASPWLQRAESMARLRSRYEVHLTKVKGYRRNWATPRCYFSHMSEQAAWTTGLIHDLREAGVYVVEKTEQVEPDDFVVVIDTPTYQNAFQSSAAALAADSVLVRERLGKRGLISLSLTGRAAPHEINICTVGDFCDDTHYPIGLFDLVLNLYAIPFTHAGFDPLRRALHEQWEQTLAGKKGVNVTSPLKVFISYSHKDEEFKDELVTMLAGLQRQGVIDAWQDRRIEEGDEWYQAIQAAMNECDLAILLVSQHFIASRFIQDEELPRFLQRRREQGLRVVPIIVRPCTWQSEPVLKDLQALPKDGKAVITFSPATGERDQVWTDIATAIEKRARARDVPRA